jgi:periplasmic protein TonB
MAQAPHVPGQSESESQFIKRERKSIALFSVAFIAVSAITHFALGGLGAGIRFPTPPPEQVQPIRFDVLVTPTPLPLPTPTLAPTPTPLPQRQHPQRQQQQAHHVTTNPIVRQHPPDHTGTPVPTRSTDASPGPSDGGSSAPATAAPLTGDSGVIKDATFLNKVEPAYPDFCRESGIQGVVVVLVTLGPDGRVLDVRVEQPSTCGAMDQAALAAARRSTYTAPLVDGRPVTQTYRIVYTFQLGD